MSTKYISILVLFLAVYHYSAAFADSATLDIKLENKKISIKAKGVTQCQVLAEFGEKTNTKIRNDNKCDTPVNLNIEKKSLEDALKMILKQESYVFVNNAKERKLLVYNRNNQSSDRSAYTPEPARYIPDPVQPDPSYSEAPQAYEQPISVAPDEIPPPIPAPSEPPFDPAALNNPNVEGGAMPDPNQGYVNP